MSNALTFAGLKERWREFADTDYTKGQKISDARKQEQYELLRAGQSLAYATAADELEALEPRYVHKDKLRELRDRLPHTKRVHAVQDGWEDEAQCVDNCTRCALTALLGEPDGQSQGTKK